MKRDDLEHIIRASGDITKEYEFVVVGSQSIHGSVMRPDRMLTMSVEADIYPLNAPELADLIDGAIGEGSIFHDSNGYYAQGVGPETAVLPSDWMTRVHKVQNGNTDNRIGYCLDALDLFLSKAAAAREKDRQYCLALLKLEYLRVDEALNLVERMYLDSDDPEGNRRRLRATIRRWAKDLSGSL